jgi:DNA-3-methyladenine glycosylase II
MKKAAAHLSQADPVLARIIERAGPQRMQYLQPNFETLARSIVYQQLSGKAARTIYGRLEAAARPVNEHSILKLKPSKMRSLGLSRQKTGYIRDLARKTRSGELDFSQLPRLDDAAVIETLTRVKGIGTWTAHMFLIFALRRKNILPTGDLGVRLAIQKAYGLKQLPDHRQIQEIAHPWNPHCSAATWYLWRSLDGPAGM